MAALGPNLVVQITVTGARLDTTSTAFPGYRRGNRLRVWAHSWSGTPPATGSNDFFASKIEVNVKGADASPFGVGCLGSVGIPHLALQGTGKLGSNVNADLSRAPANAVTALRIGTRRLEPAVDLTPLGATGCWLYVPDTILVFGVASASGQRSVPGPVPNATGLAGARVYVQYLCQDNFHPLGWTTSNYGRILFGN